MVPVATLDTEGAFLGKWRKMSIDGLEWDIPDTEENAAEFGYAGDRKNAGGVALPEGEGGDDRRGRVARGGAGGDRPL